MKQVPRRRGRPPAAAVQAMTAAKPAEKAEALPERRRRAKLGGHALKLRAPERAGYVRRWGNDDGNRIADLEELGYSIVSDPNAETHSLGSQTSRRAGTNAEGKGLSAILMETPVELYEQGMAEREAHNSQVDQAIVAGADFTGEMRPEDGAYGRGSVEFKRTG